MSTLSAYIHTAVVHAVEPESVHLAEVEVLANDVDEFWDFCGDGGNGFILVEGEGPVMHDGFVVVCCVLVSYVVIVVLVEVVFKPCRKLRIHKSTQPHCYSQQFIIEQE